MIATAGAYNDILKEKLYNKDSAVHCGRSTERVYKRVVPFICTDSFLPLTCKKIRIGAHASVHLKTIFTLYSDLSEFLRFSHANCYLLKNHKNAWSENFLTENLTVT